MTCDHLVAPFNSADGLGGEHSSLACAAKTWIASTCVRECTCLSVCEQEHQAAYPFHSPHRRRCPTPIASSARWILHTAALSSVKRLKNYQSATSSMGLPGISSSAKNTLGSTLLGRLLGTSSDNKEPEESLPQLKFKPGEEPHTPRAGSPGFQNGHWVSLFRQNPATVLNPSLFGVDCWNIYVDVCLCHTGLTNVNKRVSYYTAPEE